MKKQFKNSIFKSVLLLLSVVLLIVGAVVVAVANTSATSMSKTLTVEFDENVKTCEVEYTDPSGKLVTKEVRNGDVIEVLHGVKVSIEVTPHNGMWPSFTFGNEEQSGSAVGNVVRWREFIADNTVSVTCENRVYTLHALNYTREDGLYEYNLASVSGGWTITDLTNGSATYQSGINPTAMFPKASMGTWEFEGWYIVTSESEGGIIPMRFDEEKQMYYIPKDMEMTTYMYEQDGVICVFPKFKAPLYEIYRQDHIYKGDATPSVPMFSYMMQAEAGTQYSAIWSNFWDDDEAAGGYVSYKGYLLMTHMCKTPCGQDVCSAYSVRDVLNNDGEGISAINTLVRYYTPIIYNLTYVAVPTGYAGPDKYVYGTATESPIGNPSKAGYTFLGWLVELYDPDTDTWYNPHERDESKIVAPGFALGDKNAYYDEKAGKWQDLNDIYAAKAKADGTGEIRLTAQWAPITYTIDYKWGDGVNQELANQLDNLNSTLPGSFVFDSGMLEITNPTRPGYTFKKWVLSNGTQVLEDADSGLTAGDGKYLLDCGKHPYHITLTAEWERETYNVVLDSTPGVTILGVEYDNKNWMGKIPTDLAAPTKEGYTFVGYYWGDTKYFDAVEGKLVAVDRIWTIDGGNDGATVTLTAVWDINQYDVKLDSIAGLPAGSNFTVKIIVGTKEYPFTAFPISVSLDYNTTFRVEIQLTDALKFVTWNGEKVSEYSGTTFYSNNITLGANNLELSAEVRPAKPNVGAGYDIDVVVKSETEIQVDFKDADMAQKYDIAISETQDDSNLAWKQVANGEKQYIFANCQPGTRYYVFVRLRPANGTLAGIPEFKTVITHHNEYIQAIENDLRNLITDTDGDCVKALINKALEDIGALIPEDGGELPDGFKDSVDGIVAIVQAMIAFAREQDSKIAALQAYFDKCIHSGSFNTLNLNKIGSLCADAVSAISVATTKEKVEELYNDAMQAMMAVPVSYLKNDSITLSSFLGLNQGSSITLNSIQDIKALRRAIADAIAQGKITADSFITVEAATELLRTLDTISAYNFSIVNVQISEGDVFTLTLTIPEAFINRTGMQVAYFNQATGMLELLETVREGNTLVFKAKYIADIVILADPVIDLTATIIVLGAILFCQLLAIVFVLAARSKAKKSVLHASVALPMFLTVHFLPVANAELIVLGLGVAVLVAQIVLMWLLLSSGMIRVFKTKRTRSTQQEVTAVVREEDLHHDPYAVFDEEPETEETDGVVDEVVDEVVEEALDDIAEEFIQEATEEEVEDSVEEALDEESFDEELAEKLSHEQSEEYADEAYTDEAYLEEVYAEDEYAEEEYVEEEYANEEYVAEEYADEAYVESDEAVAEDARFEATEEVYEDEEFIEQSPETYYSTDEEENVYAYDEEEAERTADAQETNEEAEETAYDTDPFEGVFGESNEQGRDSADEGGDPSYEEPYGESYEFADAEDATPEDADREEAEGQGAIDPTSYLVIDEEEISDDEEMYRYDE